MLQLEKNMNSLISSAIGEIFLSFFSNKDRFLIKLSSKFEMPLNKGTTADQISSLAPKYR